MSTGKMHRGKSRTNWRSCQICKQANKPVPENPMVYVCQCHTRYVHYDCQAKQMTESGRIHCDTCKGEFTGVRYTATNKNFFQYLWDESRARGNLMTTFSMVVSMCFTVASLMRTYFFDMESLLEELVSFEWHLDREAIKHDISVIMMVHAKLLLPVLSIYITGRAVYNLFCDFREWQKSHFNIAIMSAPPSQMSRTKSLGGKRSRSYFQRPKTL